MVAPSRHVLAGRVEQGLERFPLEVMGHEIGHHVLAPADLTDQARLIARIRRGLPTKEHRAGFVANLYTDLLINDRLQRSSGLGMAAVYQALGGGSTEPLWTLYMRMYEILWRLQTGTLAKGELSDQLEGDAHLGSRLIRSYARDWLDGAGNSEWGIALRSAYVDGSRARLYAGCGIVAGSDPASEVAEAESKFRVMREALTDPEG